MAVPFAFVPQPQMEWAKHSALSHDVPFGSVTTNISVSNSVYLLHEETRMFFPSPTKVYHMPFLSASRHAGLDVYLEFSTSGMGIGKGVMGIGAGCLLSSATFSEMGARLSRPGPRFGDDDVVLEVCLNGGVAPHPPDLPVLDQVA